MFPVDRLTGSPLLASSRYSYLGFESRWLGSLHCDYPGYFLLVPVSQDMLT